MILKLNMIHPPQRSFIEMDREQSTDLMSFLHGGQLVQLNKLSQPGAACMFLSQFYLNPGLANHKATFFLLYHIWG